MKKIYMTPATRWAEIEETSIIATSGKGGVDNDGTLGDEFNKDDVSYGRDFSSKNLWDEQW